MKSIRTSLVAASVVACLSTMMTPVHADKVERLEATLIRMQAQMDQIQAELAEAKAAARTPRSGGFAEGVSVSGLIDLRASHTKGYAGAGAEDAAVAEVSVTMEAALNDWVAGAVTLKAEEGSNNDALAIDEALITMDLEPVNIVMGRSSSVFGALETHMVSDPMTLDLAETAATMIRLETEHGGFGGGVYVYNGDAKKAGDDDDELNHYGADLGYAWASGDVAGSVGVGWISNVADSGGGENVVAARRAAMVHNVPAYTIHGRFETGSFGMVGEYIRANRAFDAAEIAFNGNGAQPSAWNLEGAYGFESFGVPASFALGLSGTEEAAGFGLAKQRVTGAVAFEMTEGATLALEWQRQEDYDSGDAFVNNGGAGSGSGDDQDTYTVQVAMEF